jgi:hypothetical protein
MNYIKKLEELDKIKNERLEAYANFLYEIKSYLQSSKFKDDNLVNVNDVLLRIKEFENTIYKGN